jgi:hypothetical protein
MANRREEAPATWFILFYFIFKLNRFGLVWVGRFRYTKTRNRTELDIFLNILTGLIDFFYRFGFFLTPK